MLVSHTVLEAVPNFSEGRRLEVVSEIADRIESVPCVDVVWRDIDPDHHRSVITFLGPPQAVEEAAVRSAAAAAELIELRKHHGVHPRIGALDVLPFVPLEGVTSGGAVIVARRAARRIADEVGVPVYFYGLASDPPGRRLFEFRRRGAEGEPGGGKPDLTPPGWSGGLHPTAGAVCVGVRTPLLAWNVELEDGADLDLARSIAARIRESGAGFPGLRALGLWLEGQGRVQVSMNLERFSDAQPDEIYRRIDWLAREGGGAAGRIEVIGLVPDEAAAALRRLGWPGLEERLISDRVSWHLERREAGC